MTISSINMAMGASSYGAYNMKLTQATANKLNELGIPYDPNITESQGQQLLRTAQASQKTQYNKDKPESESNESKDPIYKKLLELAQKLGISPDGLSFNELISKIEETLENKIASAKNDESRLLELKQLSQTLAEIQAQNAGSMGYDSTNKALEMSLELLSQYNKGFINQN